MNRRRIGLAASAAAMAAVATLQPVATPAARAAPNCAEPGRALAPVPWPQRMLDVERVWPLTRGDNVRVAVLDSGTDATHPQLAGRVGPGTDVLQPGGDGRSDCAGRGTRTAGIVVAQPAAGVGFRGVAPQATVVPVRVSDNEASGPSGGPPGLAVGLRFAVDSGARVVLVSFAVYANDPGLEAEVAAAVGRDVLIVAAVGDDNGPSRPNRTPYPAAYPDVLGVGAIDESTLVLPESGAGPFVDLVAPGGAVVSTQRGGGLVIDDGTAYAAAYVAGAAALVRAAWPEMPAAEVARRLTATAAPAPGGVDAAAYGSGIVSPYAAVADQLAATAPGDLPGLGRDSDADRVRARNWRSSANLAMLLAAIAVLVTLACIGIAAALPRGRRARWRPRVAARPVQRHEDEEPAPPVRLFADRET
jgi:membrane-anchored mycosin MYCP